MLLKCQKLLYWWGVGVEHVFFTENKSLKAK